MDATSTASLITTFVGDVGDTLVAALPTVLTFAAAILGLFTIIYLVKGAVRGRG